MSHHPALPPVAFPSVNLAQTYEIQGWMASLNCSEADLREAVALVGQSPTAVHTYLHGGKGPEPRRVRTAKPAQAAAAELRA